MEKGFTAGVIIAITFSAHPGIDKLVDFTRRLFAFGHSFLLCQIR
jgi:hypothetical protein